MSVELQNGKRIAKNTLLLYFRMLLTMAVSLYTSRVVLRTLGVEDFGIYNVVGGVVAMFSILSGSLATAISRFLTFELGKKDGNLSKVFSSAMTIQFMLALIIIVLAEIIGLTFLNWKMSIPPERLGASNWVLQLSILTFCVNLISVPYNAAIIAHERMSAFAYIGVFEVLCKLGIAWAILVSPVDKLIFYSFLMAFVALVIRFVYGRYCKVKFPECTFHFEFDRNLVKRMFSFAGWNFFGSGSYHLMTQGVNVLINLFFGVTMNAARGIATQVDMAVMQFVNNFTTAINPQITKSYASGNFSYLYDLIFKGAKYSYFLLLFFSVPIVSETDVLLVFWLGHVPAHTANFVRLAFVISLIQVLSNSMITAMLATGKIRKYQIIVGGLGMLVFPLSLVAFKMGLCAEIAYVINIVVFLVQLVVRLFLLKEMISLPISRFVKEVLTKVVWVSLVVSIPVMCVRMQMNASYERFFIVSVLSVILSLLSVYFWGLEASERNFVKSCCRKVMGKICH